MTVMKTGTKITGMTGVRIEVRLNKRRAILCVSTGCASSEIGPAGFHRRANTVARKLIVSL